MLVRRSPLVVTLPFALAAPVTLAASLLAASPATAAVQPAPAPGTCWNYTYEQATEQGYTGTPIDCAELHTVETVTTLDVPADIAAKGPKSPRLVLWLDQRCQPEVNRYAGVAKPDTAAPGTRTWYLWYTPTAKQWKAGAHWVSCAAGSVPSDEKRHGKLIPVAGSIAGAGEKSRAITFRTSYGLGTYTARKPMSELADQPYPGSDGLQKKAGAFCEKALGHRKFFWYGPSETDWVNGYTAVRCYSLKKT